MGRAPCCDKANVKKGPWSPEEDAKLKAYMKQQGTGGNWIALPQKIGLKRCGKSCRLRWLNYLRPNIKHGGFSEEEDNIICSLYVNIGSRWSIIAAQLPGRTDNDIKNYWNTRLKKKLLGKQRKEQQAQAQARRVSTLKQESKRETENLVLPVGVISQTPYWSAEHSLPIPVANASIQDHDLNNQASFLRNLVTKLGGIRFSNDHQQPYTNVVTTTMNSQYSCDIYFPQDQLYPSTMNMITSAGVVSTANDSNICHTSNIFQEFGNFPNDLSELACVNPLQIDGSMQVFYEMESMDMANGSMNTTSTGSSTSWGDINSMPYSPLLSDYEGCQQIMPQHVTFEKSMYFGMQMQ